MVIVNKDIDSVATWYFDMVSKDAKLPLYKNIQINFLKFIEFLKYLKSFDLFKANKVCIEEWEGNKYYKSESEISTQDIEHDLNFFERIRCEPLTILVENEDVFYESFWRKFFHDWSGLDNTVPLFIRIDGCTLLYINGKGECVEEAISLYIGVALGWYIKSYVTDWMPYQLDGVTENLDYERNFFRLKSALLSFIENEGYNLLGEGSIFALVNGVDVLNPIGLNGERIGIDENGNFL